MSKPLFEYGTLLGTPAALQFLADKSLSPLTLLNRHLVNDSDCGKSDLKLNELALSDGSRIFSTYKIAGETIFVITESENDTGVRESTTILMATEY